MKTMTKRIASVALAVMMAVVMLASAVPHQGLRGRSDGHADHYEQERRIQW